MPSRTEHYLVFYLRKNSEKKKSVLWIRIRRINMFLGLPDPDPLVRGKDPVPDPSLFS
jgi:hypothetical protein